MHFCCEKKRKSIAQCGLCKNLLSRYFSTKKTWNQFALCINCWITLLGVFTQFFQSVSKIFVFPHCVLTTSTSGSFTLILFSIRCLQTYCWVKWIHSKKNILKKAFFFFSRKLHRVFWKLKIKSMKSWCTLDYFKFYLYQCKYLMLFFRYLQQEFLQIETKSTWQ